MKRTGIVVLTVLLLCSLGCKPKHPSKVMIDPGFDPNDAGTILVAPVISSITEGEDPNRDSERLSNKILWEMLSMRADHTFLSPEQMRIAVSRGKLGTEYERFELDWMTKHEVDVNFLRGIKEALNVDLILIPHVYLWFKDEADYREVGTASSTQVGITMSLIDPASGLVVWEATDENFKESVRTEGDRARVAVSGWDRRIDGVTVTGYVKDIREFYWLADVCVIPLRIARGLQNKVIEAMASGKPVVATSNASDGIICRVNEDIVIADDEDQFADQVIGLLKNENRREDMGRKALENVRKHYNWDENLKAFEVLLEQSTVSSERKIVKS